MRILYGVSSDGQARIERTEVVAAELVARGHEVRLATAGLAAVGFRARGFEVIDLETDVKRALEQALHFEPEVVLTDFSYFACLVAHLARVPVLPIAREPRGSYDHPG
ncbi:MAG TPA: hypothetical protein VFZ53_06245 [Polyangiaceae bacterium]